MGGVRKKGVNVVRPGEKGIYFTFGLNSRFLSGERQITVIHSEAGSKFEAGRGIVSLNI